MFLNIGNIPIKLGIMSINIDDNIICQNTDVRVFIQMYAGAYLEHHFLDEVLRKLFVIVLLVPLLHELVQVLFHVLEHKVEGVVLSDDLLQLDDVVVAQLFQ